MCRPRNGLRPQGICTCAQVNNSGEQLWESNSSSNVRLPTDPQECNVTRQCPFPTNHQLLTGRKRARVACTTSQPRPRQGGRAPSLSSQYCIFPGSLAFLKAGPSLYTGKKKKNLKKSQGSGVISKCKYANSDKNIIHPVQLVICKIILMTYLKSVSAFRCQEGNTFKAGLQSI